MTEADKCRQAFIDAGYWPNEVMWQVWQKAWQLGTQSVASQSERREGHSALRVKDGKLETFDPHPSPILTINNIERFHAGEECLEPDPDGPWVRFEDAAAISNRLASRTPLSATEAIQRLVAGEPKRLGCGCGAVSWLLPDGTHYCGDPWAVGGPMHGKDRWGNPNATDSRVP